MSEIVKVGDTSDPRHIFSDPFDNVAALGARSGVTVTGNCIDSQGGIMADDATGNIVIDMTQFNPGEYDSMGIDYTMTFDYPTSEISTFYDPADGGDAALLTKFLDGQKPVPTGVVNPNGSGYLFDTRTVGSATLSQRLVAGSPKIAGVIDENAFRFVGRGLTGKYNAYVLSGAALTDFWTRITLSVKGDSHRMLFNGNQWVVGSERNASVTRQGTAWQRITDDEIQPEIGSFMFFQRNVAGQQPFIKRPIRNLVIQRGGINRPIHPGMRKVHGMGDSYRPWSGTMDLTGDADTLYENASAMPSRAALYETALSYQYVEYFSQRGYDIALPVNTGSGGHTLTQFGADPTAYFYDEAIIGIKSGRMSTNWLAYGHNDAAGIAAGNFTTTDHQTDLRSLVSEALTRGQRFVVGIMPVAPASTLQGWLQPQIDAQIALNNEIRSLITWAGSAHPGLAQNLIVMDGSKNWGGEPLNYPNGINADEIHPSWEVGKMMAKGFAIGTDLVWSGKGGQVYNYVA